MQLLDLGLNPITRSIKLNTVPVDSTAEASSDCRPKAIGETTGRVEQGNDKLNSTFKLLI